MAIHQYMDSTAKREVIAAIGVLLAFLILGMRFCTQFLLAEEMQEIDDDDDDKDIILINYIWKWKLLKMKLKFEFKNTCDKSYIFWDCTWHIGW